MRSVSIALVSLAALLTLGGCYTRARVVAVPVHTVVAASPPQTHVVATATAAPAYVVVREAPPPIASVDVRTSAPSRDALWVDGYFHWEGRWVWEPGHWETGRTGYVWIGPVADDSGGQLVYHPGYWCPVGEEPPAVYRNPGRVRVTVRTPEPTVTVRTPEPPRATVTVRTPEPPRATVTVRTPEPPRATVTVRTPEPPRATVTVRTPEPPRATVTVRTPEPPRATVTVRAPEPAPSTTVTVRPPATTVTVRPDPRVTATTPDPGPAPSGTTTVTVRPGRPGRGGVNQADPSVAVATPSRPVVQANTGATAVGVRPGATVNVNPGGVRPGATVNANPGGATAVGVRPATVAVGPGGANATASAPPTINDPGRGATGSGRTPNAVVGPNVSVTPSPGGPVAQRVLTCSIDTPRAPLGGYITVTGTWVQRPTVRIGGQVAVVANEAPRQLRVQVPGSAGGGMVTITEGGNSANCGQLSISSR